MRAFVRTPLFVLAAFLVVGGIAARLYAFTVPSGLIYDEHHFVSRARTYIAHQMDTNDHPPLGKLVIAASVSMLGDNARGWRLPSELIGIAVIFLAAFAAARLFQSLEAGAIAAALVASDGFFIAFSRVAVLDGQLVSLLVASLLLVTFSWRWHVAALAGVLLGAACTVKFSGIGLIPLFGAALFLDQTLSLRARLTRVLVIGASAAVTFFAIYAIGLSLAGQPTGVSAVLDDCRRLFASHAQATAMKNPWVSSWPTWFIPTTPLGFYRDEHLGQVRMVTMLGNLATWWTTSMLFFGALGWVVRDGVRAVRETVNGRATLVLLAAALGFLAPWVLTHRDSYLYHYLPTYFALVLVTTGAVTWLRTKRPLWALGFLCVVTIMAALYAPFWTSLPTSQRVLDARLFREAWR
ncbi:MAG: phospholipid carrier-dependent glycosyltransferase [Archangium sp.]|nr:phospholipid carrier-dependent glycosyltransferase [Archangium sp.]